MGLGGVSVATAPTLEPGTYPNEYIPAGNETVYYNVSSRVGENLTIVMTHSLSLSADLMAPNGTVLEAKYTGPGWVVLTIICDSNELYIIKVFNVGGMIKGSDNTAMKASVDLPFTLTIQFIGDDGGVPGFDLLAAFIGCLILIGLVVFKQHRKISIY